MKKVIVGIAALAMGGAAQAVSFDRGSWKVSFDEKTSVLSLDCPARNVSLEGKLTFVSQGVAWRVGEPRDAATDRLALVAGKGSNVSSYGSGTTYGYVSFRTDGDCLEMTALHRAGANFFPGRLAFDGTARVRADSFACRTIPEKGERVLNFADGAGDSPLNDSVFAREEDLAVRFFSCGTRLVTKGGGAYGVHIECDIDEPAEATMAIAVDAAYYGSRWAPGYRPLNRRRCPKAPTGWMSWNIYFDKAGAAENLAEARIGAKYLKPFGLDIWSIESWQDNSLWLPVRHFHHHANRHYETQFPGGMKVLADEIRKLGFKPGIWMSLYGEGDDAFYAAHKDLYLHDKDGKPIENWAGKYMLDTTKPEALALMTKLARQAREEWGYEFFKFDGMANTPRKFERPEIRACAANPGDTKWFENSVRALRAGIGDALFLGCMGDFTGTEAQFLDASRLGSDVVGCYRGVGDNYHRDGSNSFAQMPVKWKNVLHQAECTFTQIFVNNIMFYTDPDTLMVGYALEKNEAEVMATIVGLPGQLMFSGDKLGNLRPDRMKMIQQVLPVADIRPQNLYPYAASAMLPIWNLSVTRPFDRWNIVAVFNWKDEPQEFCIDFASLGLDPEKAYACHEFWGQGFVGVVRGCLGVALPMRSVKLFAVREAADRPQFVGDDRHITQGAVELTDLAWNAEAKTYTLGVKAIGGFPFTYLVRVPDNFKFAKATASNGAKTTTEKREDGLVAVTIAADESVETNVILKFD